MDIWPIQKHAALEEETVGSVKASGVQADQHGQGVDRSATENETD